MDRMETEDIHQPGDRDPLTETEDGQQPDDRDPLSPDFNIFKHLKEYMI